mmetsp:Transcript_37275/g.88017  ORF Transcript_37275/g.88017 Transcript_37275/m.88017 type:complete len:516 (+) Transcript_37275:388-1935(+)
MGDEHPADHPKMGLPTFGANVFPAEVPGMAELFLDYHAQMKGLGNKIMRIMGQALDLPSEDYIETHVTCNDPVILPRMFRYPPQEKNAAELKSGIGRHSDYGLWTMILSDAPGLEFQHPKTGVWHAVPHVPGSLIMNVGDVLDRLTSGRFVSAYHRAKNLSFERPRLSLPFFYDPAWEAKMQTLPIKDARPWETEDRAKRWENTKITCEFDGSVEYSEFLAKKVAKVFPDLVPESAWKQLKSTSEPSTRHALVVRAPDELYTPAVVRLVQDFYKAHAEIKASHGWTHIEAVYQHAEQAVAAACQQQQPPLTSLACMEVKVAALLHDIDDRKYFPQHAAYENARAIMAAAQLPPESVESVVEMISLVSCSANGNRVPAHIAEGGAWHRLIPRWADRLEAVGEVGVVRCFQYNQEVGRPLSGPNSPRPKTEAEIWQLATPERFEGYLKTGESEDMIAHYYDKLLHVARPPKEIVRNAYLEKAAEELSAALVELLLRFGKTGRVDEGFIQQLAEKCMR